ncbi:hypothetical protein QYM36_001954 [Artemia franciscana]|nr:hypothetical protein QYM36_001954 [Artemia franciscana]
MAIHSSPLPVADASRENRDENRSQNALRLFSPDLDFLEMDFDPGIGTEVEEQVSPILPKEKEEDEYNLQVVVLKNLDAPSTSDIAHCLPPPNSNEHSTNSVDVVDGVDLNSNLVSACSPEPSLGLLVKRRVSDPLCGKIKLKSMTKSSSVDNPSDIYIVSGPSVDRKDLVVILKNADSLEFKKTVNQPLCFSLPAHGISAVTHALRAFGMTHTPHQVTDKLRPRHRDLAVSVLDYLKICSEGAINQKDIAAAISNLSDGNLMATFIELNANNVDHVKNWLPAAIRDGQIPILTFPSEGRTQTFESWNHLFINQVEDERLVLISPTLPLSFDDLRTLTNTPTCVEIPADEILRMVLNDGFISDFRAIYEFDDVRWQDLNVLGQICHLFRTPCTSRQSIILPSECRMGITLVSIKTSLRVFHSTKANPV